MWIDLFRIHATFGSASASPEAISPAFDQLVAGARRTHLIARVRHLPAYGQLRQNLNSGIPGCGCLVPIANHWIIMRCILATGFLSCWPTWTTLNSTLLSRPNPTEATPIHYSAIRRLFPAQDAQTGGHGLARLHGQVNPSGRLPRVESDTTGYASPHRVDKATAFA